MSRTIAIGDIHGCSIALEAILDYGFLIGLDTGVWKGGWLTALDVESGKTWQVNEKGSLRP